MSDDFEKLAKKLPGAFATLRETTMQQVLFVALAESQQRTPVRTGTLRRSETTRMENNGARGFVGTNVKYAPFVHARTPFFADGIKAARPQIERILQESGDAFTVEVSDI